MSSSDRKSGVSAIPTPELELGVTPVEPGAAVPEPGPVIGVLLTFTVNEPNAWPARNAFLWSVLSSYVAPGLVSFAVMPVSVSGRRCA